MKHGFELVQERDIPELNTRTRLFRHVKTGAQLLSMENDDENKTFGIGFCTPPFDSTGLPHILEHGVLCGSRKYPVKEPFVELLKGSLNTFLNALTFPDKTVYPVASQNLKDFYNLIDVYLDAVFYPRLTPHVLQQEGWHYELDDPTGPLSYKGVVFNEMKGAYSDPDNLLGRYIQQTLFPDTPYGHDSGGDPLAILDLTFEQYDRFHKTYYHPSNALIFFYGDDDPDERLRLVQEYLDEFEPLTVDAELPLQPPFDSPRRVVQRYDAGQDGDEGRKTMLTVSWLLPENNDMETRLALAILSHILIGTPASPLRKALIDSGLGEDLAGSGLDTDLRQLMFATGLKGINEADADKVEMLILETLDQLVIQGIERDMIEASLNTIEFALRENNTGSYPRGVILMINALSTWLHGGDPADALAFDAPLRAVKDRLAENDTYFEDLIAAYFLQNPHRVTLILKPDAGVSREQQAAEDARLADARASMTDRDIQQVIEDTQTLRRLQETPDSPEALATIPMLGLEDLDRENKLIPLDVLDLNGGQVLYHDLFTNGIAYLDVGFNLYGLPQSYLPYVTLFGRALLDMGTETESFVKLSQRIGRTTGGISPRTFTSVIRESDRGTAWLFLRGKATTAHTGDLLVILRDVLLTARFDDRDRFRQIVLEEKAGEESGLIPGGHLVINTRLRAHFNEADWAAEQIGGVSYLFFLRALAEEIDNNWPAVLARLEDVRRFLLNRRTMIFNVTLDAANWAQFRPQLADFIAHLPDQPPALQTWMPQVAATHEGLTIPAAVNYVGKGADLYKLGYRPHGAALVITNYLMSSWLWERVRVLGGAYGGFCIFDWRSGGLTYVSYRDPNLLGTLDVYDQTSAFLRESDLSQDEVVKGIIGAIGNLDAYQLPDAKGFTSMARYLAGDTEESRQRLRDDILATTVEDFRAFGDALDLVRDHGRVVVLGSGDAIAGANASRGDLLSVTKVL